MSSEMLLTTSAKKGIPTMTKTSVNTLPDFVSGTFCPYPIVVAEMYHEMSPFFLSQTEGQRWKSEQEKYESRKPQFIPVSVYFIPISSPVSIVPAKKNAS